MDSGELRPDRRINTERVAEHTEFDTVLIKIDDVHRGPKNLDVLLEKSNRKDVRGLSTHGYDNAYGFLELSDLKHGDLAESLEVQSVRLMITGGDCIRVEIADDSLVGEST